MKAAGLSMGDSGGGSIVNISSIAGRVGAFHAFAYSASKWSVRRMGTAAAHELGRYNIRVHSMRPGIIETPMIEDIFGYDAETHNLNTSLRRAGQPEELARLALFLASEESSYISGGEYLIAGGLSE